MGPQAIVYLEKAWTRRAMVATHWLPGSNSVLWYRQWLAADKYRFMLLDCGKGTHQEAFDHEELALEFKSHMGLDLNADQLPIEFIHVEADGSCVQFRFQNTMWTFSKGGKVAKSPEECVDNTLCMDFNISKASPKSLTTAEVTLINLTEYFIDYFWVDYNGNSGRRRGGVRPGESIKLVTMLHHRWRLVQQASGKCAVLELEHATGVYTIEDSHDSLATSWQKQPFEAASSDSTAPLGDNVKPEYKAFLRQHNVWARDQSGTEWQVSYNGCEDDRYRFVYTTSDGLYAVAMQCREGCQYPSQLKNSIPIGQLRPKVIDSPIKGGYPRAGDHMDVDRPHLFNLALGKEIAVDDSLSKNPFSITHIGWSVCGKKYRFVFNERGHQHLRLLEIHLDGTVTILIEESSETVVDYNQKLYYKLLAATSDIIWASERDGWNHLYRFDLETGSLKNQITKGDWLVRSVEHVDIIKQQIWFTGYGMIKGQDAYYAQLACVDFDGCNLRLLTTKDGTHSWQWGPDQRFLIDTWSRVDLLPRVAVIEVATGKQTLVFQKQDVPCQLREKYHPFERFSAKARDDDTEIHGVIIRPYDFDEHKRYPIVEVIYAAPFQCYTPKRFKNYAMLRHIANSGFAVVVIDEMGTNWRSKAFLDKSYKNLNDAGFPDRIKWIRAAAKTRPWLDIDRVGIQGSSHGGQNAAAAVLHHGDFYKAACAEAGTHDARMGNVKWSEMYMGWHVDASYEEHSNVAHAAKLSGALMLVTGEMDEVVDPATTMQFAHALIEADKDFDLVIMPGMGHSCASGWLDKKKTRFFKTHLGSASSLEL